MPSSAQAHAAILSRKFFQRAVHHAPAAIPAMNVASIIENACELDPSASESIRVQATSYNIATNPDKPMAAAHSLRSWPEKRSSAAGSGGGLLSDCSFLAK